jgi:hypothetical protein
MTKAELIEAMRDVPDDAKVFVSDHETGYDFDVTSVQAVNVSDLDIDPEDTNVRAPGAAVRLWYSQ